MTLKMRRTTTATGAVALALALAACGGGGGGGNASGGSSPSAAGGATGASGAAGGGQTGGEIKILNQEDFEHLDPQRNFVTNSGNAGRLITRTLTQIKEEPGQPPQIISDLAREWTPSNGNKTWTYTLKDNLKYEDGTPVTSKDIKYGVERSFSPDLAEGAPYARQYLVGSDQYKGPYVGGNNGGQGIPSIKTPDDKTIVFELNQPVADFMWTTSLFTFSPVPQAKDTKTEYDNKPIATGPYKIDSYVRGQSLVLSRNPNWDKSTDEYRTALPDRFNFAFGQDATVIDQRLLADAPADQNATSMDIQVQNASLARVVEPSIASRVVEGPSNCVRYIALNMSKPPFNNLKLRQAAQFAINKDDFATARGGERFGTIANSVIPKDLAGYKDIALYQAPDAGDPNRSKQLVAESGIASPKVTLATADQGRGLAAAEAVQASMNNAGFQVELRKIPGDNYYTTIQNDAQAPEMMQAGWCYDWPSASTVVPPVFGPDNIQAPKKHSTNNYSRYNNREHWAEMKRIASEVTDPAQAAEQWSALNDKIMAESPVVPTFADGGVYLRGSKVTNAQISKSNGGEIDLVKVGVQP